MGITMNRISFYYADMKDRTGNPYYSTEVCFQKAMDAIEESIKIFKEVKLISSNFSSMGDYFVNKQKVSSNTNILFLHFVCMKVDAQFP